MEIELKNSQFNGHDIDFEIKGKSIMVNATKMAKVYPDKLTKDFLKLKSTKEFIKLLDEKFGYSVKVQEENNPLESNANCEIKDITEYDVSENILKIIHGGRNNGTWMHELIAIDFAARLNVEFK